ncbi:MAG: ExbD/TolR family protein [bacterium]
MAYRPSRRQSRKAVEALEPNMAPIMNLMVVLIPLLLSSVQLIKISVIELNLPPTAPAESTMFDEPEGKDAKLDLAVIITDRGFYLSSASAILKARKGKPSIPLKDGQYDYEHLAQTLHAIKEKAAGRFKDTDSITIQAEPKIDYQTLVSTMDAARSIKLDGREIALFPKASISAIVM